MVNWSKATGGVLCWFPNGVACGLPGRRSPSLRRPHLHIPSSPLRDVPTNSIPTSTLPSRGQFLDSPWITHRPITWIILYSKQYTFFCRLFHKLFYQNLTIDNYKLLNCFTNGNIWGFILFSFLVQKRGEDFFSFICPSSLNNDLCGEPTDRIRNRTKMFLGPLNSVQHLCSLTLRS